MQEVGEDPAGVAGREDAGQVGGVCGDAWEAMKYEKRLETAMTGYGQWYFDSRGWGDLPVGTPVHWPVPNQEADARQHAQNAKAHEEGRDDAP